MSSKPTDFLGRELNEGDEIVYSSRSGSTLNTTHAKIVTLREVPFQTWRGENGWKWKIQVIRIKDRYGEGDPKRKVSLNALSHAVKV